MKIGEAILERDYLEDRLDALGSRLSQDKQVGRPLGHLLEEIERTSNRLRDLQVALDWTHQSLTISQMPLGSYVAKKEQLSQVAEILRSVDSPDLREKVDALLEAKKETERVINTVYWAHDLMVPEIKTSHVPEEEK